MSIHVSPTALLMALSEIPETTAAMAAFSQAPSASARALYNALIKGIIADGDWPLLDWLVMIAPADAADAGQGGRVNLRAPTKLLSPVNSPAFTAQRGFAGDGATSYLLGEVLNAAGNVYSLNSAHVGVYVNQQNGSTGSSVLLGVTSGSNTQIIGSTSSTGSIRVNDATALALPTPSPATRTGHRVISRTGANARVAYLNGAQIAADTQVSSSVPTAPFSLGRLATAYGPARFAAFHSGSGLTSAAQNRLNARISTYLTAIGAM